MDLDDFKPTILRAYASIRAVGHKEIQALFENPVVVQEKVDGSQFSFGIEGGQLLCKSKKCAIDVLDPDSLFKPAVEHIKSVQDKLVPGWVYRGEAFAKAKHNTLAYERVPSGNVVLFDVEDGLSSFLPPELVNAEAQKLGIEPVRTLAVGKREAADLLDFLKEPSQLGGVTLEGVVVKNYERFTLDGKVMMGKFVRPEFKEANMKEWKTGNPSQLGFVDNLGIRYRTEARWKKAIQALRDEGHLEYQPRDIPCLLKALEMDLKKEEEEAIKDALFAFAWPKILRAVRQGFPEFYKTWLLQEVTGTSERLDLAPEAGGLADGVQDDDSERRFSSEGGGTV